MYKLIDVIEHLVVALGRMSCGIMLHRLKRHMAQYCMISDYNRHYSLLQWTVTGTTIWFPDNTVSSGGCFPSSSSSSSCELTIFSDLNFGVDDLELDVERPDIVVMLCRLC